MLWGPANAERMSVMSHQAYGPLVGVPRLLGLLGRHRIRSTFFVPATPPTIPESSRTSWRPGTRWPTGYLHEQPTGVSAEGRPPTSTADSRRWRRSPQCPGYRAPMWDLSRRSPALLAERGFLDSSLMDADVPYELAVGPVTGHSGHGSLGRDPDPVGLDDWEQFCFLPDISGSGLIETPRKARELWQDEFEALRDVGAAGS